MSINPPGYWQATGRGARFMLADSPLVSPSDHYHGWPAAAFYAHCIVNDPYKRSVSFNAKLQDYAVNKGIVFG